MEMEDIRVCYICNKSDTDNIDYGEWKQLKDITVHYYCLLFSTKLEKNADDDEGILGFLEEDIRNCKEKFNGETCFYCVKKSATVYCCKDRCKRKFHVVCGIKNNCLFQFTDEFNSFCHLHHGINDNMTKRMRKWNCCFICFEELGTYNPLAFVPSCCDKGWHHIRCMKENALHAGNYFKCPECGKNDQGKYTDMCRRRGVYVPDCDASWKESLYKCEAKPCLCKEGRDFRKEKKHSKWYLNKCNYCGSIGMHSVCGNIQSGEFICDQCEPSKTIGSSIKNAQDATNISSSNESDSDEDLFENTAKGGNSKLTKKKYVRRKAIAARKTKRKENSNNESDSDADLFKNTAKEGNPKLTKKYVERKAFAARKTNRKESK